MSFPCYRIYPLVYFLSVHLQNENPVYFNDGEEQEAMDEFEEQGAKDSQFTAWMALCKSKAFPVTKGMTFPQVQEHFVYANNKWNPRQRHFNHITEIYMVS